MLSSCPAALAGIDEQRVFKQGGICLRETGEQAFGLVDFAFIKECGDHRRRLLRVSGADTALDQVVSQEEGAAEGRRRSDADPACAPCAPRGRRAKPRVVSALGLLGNAVSVPQDLALEPLELGGRDGCGTVECARERIQIGFIRLCGDCSPVFVVQPCESRGDALQDRIGEIEGRRFHQSVPLVASRSAAGYVTNGERFAQAGFEVGQRCCRLFITKLRSGLRQTLNDRPGRALDPRSFLDLCMQPGEMVRVMQPDGLGRLDLNLPQPGFLEYSEIFGPYRVPRILGGEFSHDADPGSQRGPLRGQTAVVAQQVLERFCFCVGISKCSPCLGHQPGCGSHRVDVDDLVPLGALGEIECRLEIEQPRLGVRLLKRLRAQSLLQEALAPPEPPVRVGAQLRVSLRQLIEAIVPRLVARLEKRPDLLNDLMMIGHDSSHPAHCGVFSCADSSSPTSSTILSLSSTRSPTTKRYVAPNRLWIR